MGARPDTVFPGVPFYGRIFTVDNDDPQSQALDYREVSQPLLNILLLFLYENNFLFDHAHERIILRYHRFVDC